MEQLALPILLTIAGGYFLIRNIIHLNNENKLRSYIESSPKAKLWVNKYGVEKTMALSKKYFLPFGVLVSIGLLSAGLWSLLVLFQANA